MLSLSAEQEMVISSLEEIAQEEFADKAFTWEGDLPEENVELLANRGFLGLNIDEEYGGGGMGEFEAMLTSSPSIVRAPPRRMSPVGDSSLTTSAPRFAR